VNSFFSRHETRFYQAADGSAGEPQHSAIDGIEAAVAALACALEAKDFRLCRHSERVANHVVQIGEKLNLSAFDLELLRHGAMLHDIGNIGIADSILLKPDALSDWEFEEVRMHHIIGETICRPLKSLTPVLPLIRSHHEKINGSGYPDSLVGDRIPLMVRILSVADVYDTLRSDRAYRGAFGHDAAVDILREEAQKGWWQAEIVEILANLTAPRTDFLTI
jgi:putative two-component system response regulator